MSKFGFLDRRTADISVLRTRKRRRFLLDSFLLERSINIIYGAGGTGKTFFVWGVAKRLIEEFGYQVLYLDSDNSDDLIVSRGFDSILEQHSKAFSYIDFSSFYDENGVAEEILEQLMERAKDSYYEECVLVIDSLQFMLEGSIYDTRKISNLMNIAKRFRRAGGTVFLLHHSRKDDSDTMKGASFLRDSVDESYLLKNIAQDENSIEFVCTPTKKRYLVNETAWRLDTRLLTLQAIDNDIANMSETEREFTLKAKEILATPMSQSDLLLKMNRAQTDRSGTEWIRKYDGRFWFSYREGNKKMLSNKRSNSSK